MKPVVPSTDLVLSVKPIELHRKVNIGFSYVYTLCDPLIWFSVVLSVPPWLFKCHIRAPITWARRCDKILDTLSLRLVCDHFFTVKMGAVRPCELPRCIVPFFWKKKLSCGRRMWRSESWTRAIAGCGGLKK